MTQQAIDGQPSGDPGVTDPSAAPDSGQPTGAPAPVATGSGQTVPLAAFTVASTRNAEIAKVLGISKDSSPAEYRAAIEALRTAQTFVAPDESEMSPELVTRMRAQDEREWQGARREFGDAITDAAQSFADTMRTSKSPYDLASAFAAAVYSIGGGGATPADAGGEQTAAGEVPAVPDLGTGPGSGGPSGDPSPGDFRGNTAEYLRNLVRNRTDQRPQQAR